ncbi:MAG: tRNA (adenosine(37)-N6)-threonylcarbamoyltransferase complex ATPase subunit type 1 TsaE [Rubrivivax sp.]|nr:tRNA (adenosine(37)-N6)-threonylcarbamoyltransferase complex ATPase subunit type 1 TsaE [Rubrivivax sp.]
MIAGSGAPGAVGAPPASSPPSRAQPGGAGKGGATTAPAFVAQQHWHWRDERACAACAAVLARRITAEPALGDALVELHGPLGAGKTTFVRHLLRALGVAGRIKSPTYTVVEPYRAATAALDISHFDFYRFADARELPDAGLREVLAAPGLKLVEWPARAAAWLPPADLRLEIEPDADAARPDARDVLVTALTPRGAALLEHAA